MVHTVVQTNSNVTAQILLDGAQEILGFETLQKVIQRSLPVERPTGSGLPLKGSLHLPLREGGPFLRALEEIYGAPGGKGLALRIGRAAFRCGLKYFGDQAGFRRTEFRLLPAPRRLENGLHALARLIEQDYGGTVCVSDASDHWQWRMLDCPLTTSQECFLIAGLLQGFTNWAGGGRFYRVAETECRSAGSPACVFQIEKKPLD